MIVMMRIIMMILMVMMVVMVMVVIVVREVKVMMMTLHAGLLHNQLQDILQHSRRLD